MPELRTKFRATRPAIGLGDRMIVDVTKSHGDPSNRARVVYADTFVDRAGRHWMGLWLLLEDWPEVRPLYEKNGTVPIAPNGEEYNKRGSDASWPHMMRIRP